MKIVLATGIYPPEIGGPAGYVRGLARVLKERGHEPVVVTYGDQRTFINDGWPIEIIKRRGGPWVRYLRYALRIWKLARRNDLVYLQGPVSEGLPGTLGAWLAGKPVLMKVVGDYAWEQYMQQVPGENPELLDVFVSRRHAGSIRLLEAIERWSAKRARCLIVPSVYLQRIAEAWGVDRSRIRVIYNAIEPLPDGQTREAVRARESLTGARVIFGAARAVPWKGMEIIIQALPALPKEVVFVLAGDGPSLAGWRNLAANLGVADRIRFIGRIDRRQMAEWYRAADLFVLPSGYEGFPHVVAEAAVCGLPAYVSDQGGNPETLELLGSDRIKVLPYHNPQAWTQALAQPWLERTNRDLPEALNFDQMVNQVESALASQL